MIENAQNRALYEKYAADAKNIKNFYTLGRLAEYQYYDIDAIVERAMKLSRELLEEKLWKY